jgi:hypothetical protein
LVLQLLHHPLPLAQLSCGYRNSSDRMVIVRCLGPQEFFLERVVFPFELLSFLAPPDTEVQIWTHGLGGPELVESIPVAELVVEATEALEANDVAPVGVPPATAA